MIESRPRRIHRGSHGKRCVGAARDLLTPVYATFTEGFATRDLIDAKALLDELA